MKHGIIFIICVVNEAFAKIMPLNGSFKATNVSASELLSRDKRFLLFTPSTSPSIVRYAGGYLGPIDIPLWQNINCARNFHAQYQLPTSWQTRFPTFPGLWRARTEGRSFDEDATNEVTFKADASRKIAYELIEEMLDRDGKNGRDCLLRTICEVAETPLSHNGLIGELLQVFFTPGQHEKIDQDYRYAMKAGLHHVDCVKLYSKCPFGNGILDTFSIVRNFHFDNVLNF